MRNPFKKSEPVVEAEPQTITLEKDDVAIVLRSSGKCETVCTLKGKHSLTPQEELIIGLGGLLQNEKFCTSVREHFMTTMQNMLSSRYVEDMSSED